MIKLFSKLPEGEGHFYGFGFTETNLNRLEYNNEPIFFDFSYAGRPDLFGLIMYLPEYETPEDMAADIENVALRAVPFLKAEYGVTIETLRFFVIPRTVFSRLRKLDFWGYNLNLNITNPNDIQILFAGTDELAIERYFSGNGLEVIKHK